MALPPHKSRLSSIGPALVPKEQHQGKPAIRLLRPVYIIGSRSSARIHLISSSVSKAHAIVVRSNGRTYIRDLASRTKVYINGREKREADLEDGDLIKIGSFTFQYIAGPGEDMVDPEAMKLSPPAKLDVVGAEYPVPFEERVLLIGRRTTCDVALVEGSVSTSHAAIFEIDGQRLVRDLGSRTGTFVNGVSTHQHQLLPGDVIRIGETEMRYIPNEVAPALVVDEQAAGAEIPSLLEAVEHHETPEAAPEPVEEAEAPIAIEPSAEEETPIPIDEPLAPTVAEEPAAEEAIPVEEDVAAKVEAPKPFKIPPPPEPEPLAVEEPAARPVVEEVEAPPAEEPLEIATVDEVAAEEPPPLPEVEETEALPVEEALAVAPLDEAVEEEPPILSVAEETEAPPAEEQLEVAAVDEVTAKEPIAPVQDEFELEPLAIADEPEADRTPLDVVEAEAEAPQATPVEEPLEIAPAAEAVEEEPLAPIEHEVEPEPEPVAEVEVPEPPAIDEEPLPPAEQEFELEAPPAVDEEVAEHIEPPAPAEIAEAIEEEPPPAQPAIVAPLSLAATDVPETLAGDEYDITDTVGSAVLDLQTPAAVEPVDELPLDVAPSETLPPIEPEATDEVEVMEPTEPTPESALQSSADELAMDALASPDVPLEEALAAEEGARNLTDTSFDRAVREFAGDEIGEIVEPAAEAETEPLVVEEPEPEVAEEEVEPIAEIEPEISEAPIEAESETPFDLSALEAPAPLEEPPPLPETIEEEPLPAAKQESEPFELPAAGEPEPAEPAAATASTEVVADLEFPPVDEQHKAPEPVSEILKIRPPPPVRTPPPKAEGAPAPASDAPPGKPAPLRTGRVPWGANQHNFLGGGTPLNLRDPFGGATPSAPVPPVERKKPSAKTPMSDVPISDKAVDDLINEIDTVAAAAEQATEAAASVPPISAQDLSQALNEAPATPGSRRPPREALSTGFDGLAMPPVREMDVFSQMSPPPALHQADDDDAIDENELPDTLSEEPAESENGEPPQQTPATRRRDGTSGHTTFISRPEPEELEEETEEPLDLRGTGRDVAGQRRPLIAQAADEFGDVEAEDARHKAFRRAKMLIGTMLVLLMLTGVGIYQFLGSNSAVEGSFTFKNLAKLNKRDRSVYQEKQLTQYLAPDVARQRAHAALRSDIVPGFLDDQVEYTHVVQAAHFTDDKPDVMLLPITSRDPETDKARVAAVMTALYEMNQGDIEAAARNRRDLEDLNKQIEAGQKKLSNLNSEIQRLQLLGDSLPDAAQIKKLETDNAALEKAWQDAANAVTQTRAELEQLKSAPSTNVGSQARVEDDDKIKAMQAQLDELQSKADAAKQASAEQFDTAKKQLDGALDTFEKQLADAQGMGNVSPEISSYLQDAQQLQERTRKLTNDLIKHQEQQFGSLMELKARLNETMQQRRVEQWQKDAQLQELAERQAILTRQYNAAVSSGLDKEAGDTKVELDLTTSMIKARQDLLPADSFYAKAIDQLQGIIDATKKNIDEDRKTTETQLQALQQKFASNPAIQKLPQEQKQIADNIQNQLSMINAARQQYNKAIDVAGSTEADAALKTQISTMQAGIESRRKQLAEENLAQMKNSQTEQARVTAIEAKQTELNQRTDAATAAQTAYFDKNKELRQAQTKSQQAKENGEELSRLMAEKPDDERNVQTLVAQLELKTRQANDAVEPVKPVPNNDISITLGNDRRLLYTLSSFGAILLVFVGLIFWTLHSGSTQIPSASILEEMSAESQPPQDQAPLESNGDGKKGQGPEEDHEPATI